MNLSTHFKRSEFACKCGCGFDDVNPLLIDVLEDIRAHFNAPVFVNSACRCKKHNQAVGGKTSSQHVLGNAADIRVKNVPPSAVADYLDAKCLENFGIGRYRTFTHVDVRAVKARWGSNE
ncbi:D-Ala-D-Ala carboxypeptidase family metallohydrolase [Gilliamella sp. WF3-4]|uniref:D-Ala-D-Ala carboxypeptidase family metallohydrolase n=1 Tax=Gilliamella sp. WF3-4 TaxID=3120255 RepID=UPI00080D93C9|nr:D-Ala-D-Ala carboxypeptidase family metallohydrolase [Gilliamella apicola]OCG19627.1 serine/threonine protein kinase [Gilliamella apicola]